MFSRAEIVQRMQQRGYTAALSMAGPIPIDEWLVQHPQTSSPWEELSDCKIREISHPALGAAPSGLILMVWSFCQATEDDFAATRERVRWGTCQVGRLEQARQLADAQTRETGEVWSVVRAHDASGWYAIIPARRMAEEPHGPVLYEGQS